MTERQDFVFIVTTVSAALVAVVTFLFVVLAALSPQISVDIPGIGRCSAGECIQGGGGD